MISTNSNQKINDINISIDKIEPIDESTLNLLPCAIGHNGAAKVSNYFQTKENTQENCLVSSFRGHELKGKTLDVPQDYKGYIFRQSDKKQHEWETLSQFKDFTYWNHDIAPQTSDKQQKALESLSILSVIHTLISKEDIENEIKL
ncbi:hypothetical protein DLAC_03455 [Tieghemostelium lacteum]|uniref:Uncharacterized protein n=1 Tax=Tieghemostelium lacteum TaxID=361077 RepID=A0A152A254_TIELA|nr:hypothetical protein DLAC_03455 [Tieghemostelium lacteum]|eukprot:KYR00289.1 hypothetical protein DLAC_03455 [Tieghemostelium lacteum]